MKGYAQNLILRIMVFAIICRWKISNIRVVVLRNAYQRTYVFAQKRLWAKHGEWIWGLDHMPVISFASSKGGVSKTTTAIAVGVELALREGGVAYVVGIPDERSPSWLRVGLFRRRG